eukprot:TRINITY_DN3250_c0_g1_i1.p1 TRINITY_DN3250_c0_g1~~TRINITY_DN3250_c0_g1_i1.p1  ORF type:complete len:592 (-),score=215.23 TRINITY_DN3250_c0_g1_i1:1137-2912(-)
MFNASHSNALTPAELWGGMRYCGLAEYVSAGDVWDFVEIADTHFEGSVNYTDFLFMLTSHRDFGVGDADDADEERRLPEVAAYGDKELADEAAARATTARVAEAAAMAEESLTTERLMAEIQAEQDRLEFEKVGTNPVFVSGDGSAAPGYPPPSVESLEAVATELEASMQAVAAMASGELMPADAGDEEDEENFDDDASDATKEAKERPMHPQKVLVNKAFAAMEHWAGAIVAPEALQFDYMVTQPPQLTTLNALVTQGTKAEDGTAATTLISCADMRVFPRPLRLRIAPAAADPTVTAPKDVPKDAAGNAPADADAAVAAVAATEEGDAVPVADPHTRPTEGEVAAAGALVVPRSGCVVSSENDAAETRALVSRIAQVPWKAFSKGLLTCFTLSCEFSFAQRGRGGRKKVLDAMEEEGVGSVALFVWDVRVLKLMPREIESKGKRRRRRRMDDDDDEDETSEDEGTEVCSDGDGEFELKVHDRPSASEGKEVMVLRPGQLAEECLESRRVSTLGGDGTVLEWMRITSPQPGWVAYSVGGRPHWQQQRAAIILKHDGTASLEFQGPEDASGTEAATQRDVEDVTKDDDSDE